METLQPKALHKGNRFRYPDNKNQRMVELSIEDVSSSPEIGATSLVSHSEYGEEPMDLCMPSNARLDHDDNDYLVGDFSFDEDDGCPFDEQEYPVKVRQEPTLSRKCISTQYENHIQALHALLHSDPGEEEEVYIFSEAIQDPVEHDTALATYSRREHQVPLPSGSFDDGEESVPVDISSIKEMKNEDYWNLYNSILHKPHGFVPHNDVPPNDLPIGDIRAPRKRICRRKVRKKPRRRKSFDLDPYFKKPSTSETQLCSPQKVDWLSTITLKQLFHRRSLEKLYRSKRKKKKPESKERVENKSESLRRKVKEAKTFFLGSYHRKTTM